MRSREVVHPDITSVYFPDLFVHFWISGLHICNEVLDEFEDVLVEIALLTHFVYFKVLVHNFYSS